MKVRKRAVSSTPAIPITRSRGKPQTPPASWAIASRGLVTISRIASGDWVVAAFTTEAMTFALVITRSSRDIPGLRATPLVTTTMSEPAVSS